MRTFQISFLFLFALCVQMHAQKSNASKPKHVVKLGITPIFVGEILPSYEYIFTDKFGLEAGIGFLTENYLDQFIKESNFGNTRLMKIGPSSSRARRNRSPLLRFLIWEIEGNGKPKSTDSARAWPNPASSSPSR